MTAVEHAQTLSPMAARQLTDQIKIILDGGWELISEAYRGQAWIGLGYQSWDDYCTCEFAGARLRLPREDRQEVVASLRSSGLSTRAIAAATGLARNTVKSSLGRVDQIDPPASVTGIDGKQYQPRPPIIDIPSLTSEELEAKQREADRLEAICRHQGRLRELINGWVEIPGLADNPNREAILAGLIPPDRDRVLEIEDIYRRATQP